MDEYPKLRYIFEDGSEDTYVHEIKMHACVETCEICSMTIEAHEPHPYMEGVTGPWNVDHYHWMCLVGNPQTTLAHLTDAEVAALQKPGRRQRAS